MSRLSSRACRSCPISRHGDGGEGPAWPPPPHTLLQALESIGGLDTSLLSRAVGTDRQGVARQVNSSKALLSNCRGRFCRGGGWGWESIRPTGSSLPMTWKVRERDAGETEARAGTGVVYCRASGLGRLGLRRFPLLSRLQDPGAVGSTGLGGCFLPLTWSLWSQAWRPRVFPPCRWTLGSWLPRWGRALGELQCFPGEPWKVQEGPASMVGRVSSPPSSYQSWTGVGLPRLTLTLEWV